MKISNFLKTISILLLIAFNGSEIMAMEIPQKTITDATFDDYDQDVLSLVQQTIDLDIEMIKDGERPEKLQIFDELINEVKSELLKKLLNDFKNAYREYLSIKSNPDSSSAFIKTLHIRRIDKIYKKIKTEIKTLRRHAIYNMKPFNELPVIFVNDHTIKETNSSNEKYNYAPPLSIMAQENLAEGLQPIIKKIIREELKNTPINYDALSEESLLDLQAAAHFIITNPKLHAFFIGELWIDNNELIRQLNIIIVKMGEIQKMKVNHLPIILTTEISDLFLYMMPIPVPSK